jgi:rubrerythrin
LPRHQEHLKTGFTAEAVSAAQYRAYAHQAQTEGLENLAAAWRRLAEDKDRLAVTLLEMAGKVLSEDKNIEAALALERYEIEVLYPRLMADADEEIAGAFGKIKDDQEKTLSRLEEVRAALISARGDIPA